MISMQDDDDDSLLQVKHVEHDHDLQAVLEENGHAKLINSTHSENKNTTTFTIISLDPHASSGSAFKHKKFQATSLKEMK